MRFLAPGLLVLGMLVSLPQTASAQPCQTRSLPELNTIDGTISNADCVMTPFRNARGEFWNLYLNAGETVIITMNRVTMQDPYLYLLNPSAAVVASNDDAIPPNRNSRIQYVAAATGMHRVIATTFALQPTADNGTYEIRAEIAGHPACQTRNLPNATTMNATLDATDCIIQPYRGARGEIWTIAATAGNPIVVNMNRFTMTDPYLFLLDAGFQSLASNDDFVPPNRDARITVPSAPYTGTYYIVATSFAASDPGAYSIRFEGTPAPPPPPAGVPGPPGQPTATVNGSQVTLAWTAPTTGATPILEYLLDVGTAPGAGNLGTFSMGGNTSIVASFPNGTFFVRVRARNAVGTGANSPETTIVVGTVVILTPPRSLTASISGRSVTVNWLPPLEGPPDFYRIAIGSAPGASNLGFIDLPGGITSASSPNTAPGQYFVRILAVRGGSISAPSNEVSILVF